jgi:ribosomal protein S18 acetylase RimI-like enzyme
VAFVIARRRNFLWEDDFEAVRAFLAESHSITKSFRNWIPSQFENIRYGPCGKEYKADDDNLVKIWESTDESEEDGSPRIVAVTNRSPPSLYWIHIHPENPKLEGDIVRTIEEEHRGLSSNEDQDSEIRILVQETDEDRQALYSGLGYRKADLWEYNRRMPTDALNLNYEVPEGFAIRRVDLEEDFSKYRAVLASVFPHCVKMTERTAKIYTEASFYKEDLDLVVVAPDRAFAAFVTVRMDPVSRIAELEPVGTHPDHRRLGLGKSVILEGLKRLQKYRPSVVCIPGAAPTEAANRLYESVGFTDKVAVYLWRKTA